MNLTYTRPGELRKPDVDVLPDGRIRITRYIAAGHGDRDYSEVTETVGTADKGLATALLVKRGMAQINGKDAIVKTYEVRNASSETLVGLPDVQYTESGQKTMVYDYIQMSSGTYTPGTIGTTQAPDDATCILRTEQTEDDGTTRQIRRVFINKGLLQQSDETRNNGALLLKTFVYLNDAPVPNPPTGYTLISQRTENPNGLETTTYTYAKGDGEISRDDSTSNNGALLRSTIRYLTSPAITVNPIVTPSGYTLIDESYQDSDGHKVWTAVYAKGDGQISQDDSTSNNGALLRRTIRHLTVPSGSNPISTPAGYTLVDQNYQDSDGHRVWTAVYVWGIGEISRDVRYSQSTNQGTVGVTITTIRYLTPPGVGVNPITPPSGGVLISEDKQSNDGHTVWTGIYAKGTGLVIDDSDVKNSGKLVVYRRVSLGTAPSTPSPTIGGSVTLVSQNVRKDSGYEIYEYSWAEGIGQVSQDIRYNQSSNQGTTGSTVYTIRYLTDASVTTNPITAPASTVLISEDKQVNAGYIVWTGVYAKGTGLVSESTDTRNTGKLVIYRRVSLGTAPSTPSGTIGGSVTLTSSSVRNDNGYNIYEYSWAEGVGELSRDTRYIQSNDGGTNGATVITIRYLSSTSTNSNPIATPASTVLISEDYQVADGYKIWSASYAKGSGTVVDNVDSRNGGRLKIYRKVGLGSAPSTPSATIGGTVISIGQDVRKDNGYDVYEYTWAEGIGIIAERIQYREGGLRLVNRDILVAQGSTSYSGYSPSGVEVDISYTDTEGVRRYSVTCMQNSGGNDPTYGSALVYGTKTPFTYPGRAKAYNTAFSTGGYNYHYAYDVFLSPPVQLLVDSTVNIYYTTSNASPSTSYSLWNPTEWATMRAKWVGWSQSPRSKVEGLRGYICSNSGLSGYSYSATDRSVLGDRVFANTDFEILLSGGPGDPAGGVYTISIEKVPAFTSTSGTQYYRVTEVYGQVPIPPSLPV